MRVKTVVDIRKPKKAVPAKQAGATEGSRAQGAVASPPRFKFDATIYNGIVRVVSLGDIRLIGSEFAITPAFFAEKNKAKSEGRPELELKFGWKFSNKKLDRDGCTIFAQVDWNANSKVDDSETLAIKATYVIYYTYPASEKDLDEQHALFFLERVGKFAIFPYFRALVSRYSDDAGAGLHILPVLKEK